MKPFIGWEFSHTEGRFSFYTMTEDGVLKNAKVHENWTQEFERLNATYQDATVVAQEVW